MILANSSFAVEAASESDFIPYLFLATDKMAENSSSSVYNVTEKYTRFSFKSIPV